MSAKTDSAREKAEVKANWAKLKKDLEAYKKEEAAEFERIKEWKRLTDIISIVSLRLLHAQECKDSSCTRNVFHWLSHFPYASLWIAERMRWDTEEFHDEELAASALEEAHHLVPVPHSTGRDQGLPLLLREIASIRLSTPEEERDNA
jgi:predicted house-cleaning noncanonical NTP pyrophosphatase (MazG superfamily)